jgi:colicin import membrane protein
MVALSIGAHFALMGAGAAWMKWQTSPLINIRPVTTVDLVGAIPPPPAAEEAPPAPGPPPDKKAPAKERPAPKEPPARPGAMAPHDAKPDTRSLSDALAALRARKAAETNAGRAISEKRAQQELAERLRSLRDRNARQVDLSALGPVTGWQQTAGRPSDAKPEEIAYSKALYEALHASWVERYGKGLVAVIHIKIRPDGSVVGDGSDFIVRSSGNLDFDMLVKKAIFKAVPLPVPPLQLRGGESYFEVVLNFYSSGGF